MDYSTLELTHLEQKLMQLYKRYGPIGLIGLATVVSVVSSVLLIFGVTVLMYGDMQFEAKMAEFAEYVHFMILVPAMIAPCISYLFTRLLGRLDAAYEVVTELSTTDPLTGSANRRGFLNAAKQNIHTLRDANLCMFGMVDLDKFKVINDTYGHKVGDEVLLAVALRLEEAVGELGVVGRLGGDEFAFIALGSSDELEALRTPINTYCSAFEMDDGLAVSCSIGMVLLDEGESIEDVLARADRALYDIKKGGNLKAVA